jgi:hypothetical protein
MSLYTSGINVKDKVLTDPWVAPLRHEETIGWAYHDFGLNVNLPPNSFTPLSEKTAEEVAALGLEQIALEVYIVSHPEVYCRCYINGILVCSPIGCCPMLANLIGTTSADPVYCHIYDTTGHNYGVVCKYRKDLGHGLSFSHGLYNSTAVAQVARVFLITYYRKIVFRGE